MNHVWDIVSKAREEWESESGSRSGPQQTTSISDTHLLVSTISAGKNLKMPVSTSFFNLYYVEDISIWVYCIGTPCYRFPRDRLAPRA